MSALVQIGLVICLVAITGLLTIISIQLGEMNRHLSRIAHGPGIRWLCPGSERAQ